ncbi:MAG: hypothetical protein QM759_01060 [Terricaulis sp.]
MSDFDAMLKRSFAEAHEPVDDGFTVAVGHAVARAEQATKVRALAQTGAMAIAGAAIVYGVYGVLQQFAPQLLDQAGLQVARAHGVLSSAPTATGLLRSFGSALPQVLLMLGAVAGGAVAYRQTQEEA